MQDWIASVRNGVTRMELPEWKKGWKENKKAIKKELKDKRCLLTLDLKPFRS